VYKWEPCNHTIYGVCLAQHVSRVCYSRTWLENTPASRGYTCSWSSYDVV